MSKKPSTQAKPPVIKPGRPTSGPYANFDFTAIASPVVGGGSGGHYTAKTPSTKVKEVKEAE